MEITIPKISAIDELETFLRGLLYRKTSEVGEWITYQGPFEFGVARQNILLSARDFVSFVRAIEVKGGYKRKRGDMLLVQPYRTKSFRIRVSEDYQELLSKVSKRLGKNPSEHARISLLDALQGALGAISWPEKEIPNVRGPLYKETHPIGKARLSIRMSNEQCELLEKVANFSGQTPSQYSRMVLESGLPREATALGLIEKPQTSESAPRG